MGPFTARRVRFESLEDRLLLATVVLTPSKDNTLIEFPVDRSNGAGELFAGRVGGNQGTTSRRAVMAFDLSNIPAGSTITDASLQLTVSRAGTEPGPVSMSLHRLTNDWGEGTSNGGGQGSPAGSGDATWLHRSFDTVDWTNPGGDFVQSVSASTTVSGTGDTPQWSSAGLVADVQGWLNAPNTNFGWILVGDESSPRTVKRFNSKDRGSNPPRLTVTFDEAQPTISLVIAADEVSENAGAAATTARVTRTGDTSSALVVNLASDDGSEAAVAATVTIDAGQLSSPPFNIDAIDDAIVDGTQTVTLTASASGFATATDTLNVLDDDVATLTLTIAAGSISEGAGPAATTATVARNTETSGPLVVNLTSDDASEATLQTSVTIPSGATASLPFNLDAVDDTVVDGTQTVTISATAQGFVNGTDTVDVTDDDVAALTVLIAAAAISEGDGAGATTATVSRNTDLGGPLLVSLSSSDTSEASVPATVTIPAGQAISRPFDINAVDDVLADGTQTVTILASAPGLANGSAKLDVTDDDTAALTLNLAADMISEGAGPGATTATVSRNTDPGSPLVVTLTSEDTSEAAVPATVTIPAGQTTSNPFSIDAIDDALVDGTQTVKLTAAASGHTEGTAAIEVTDDDVAQLSLTLAAASVSEADGAAATTATVSRNSGTSGALLVNLFSSDTSEATVPQSVTIPDGQSSSAPFEVSAVDDLILDGTQTVTITASAAAFQDGTGSLDVTDDEVATLTLSLASPAVSEADGAAATTATVTRLGDIGSSLVVNLFSSDTSEATVPATLTIPAGETTSAPFAVAAVDDSLVDGTQTVTLTARAAGFVDGTDSLDVTDDDFAALSLAIAAEAVSEAAGANATTATVARNTTAAGSLDVTLTSGDTTELAVPATVTIPAGSMSVTFAIDAVDDLIDDGTQQVTITASAAGFLDGADAIDVTDDDITVTIPPARDNTLYEDQSGGLSNGAGDFLFAGKNGSGAIRRAALAFDLAAAGIPSSANIGVAELKLSVTRTSSQTPVDVSLHRLNADWGEGSSHANGQEGGCAAATTGDATWLHSFFDTSLWTNAGGDFNLAASATSSVADEGAATWNSAQMATDVAAWLAAPATNFGWTVVGGEGSNGTAKRFDSRETTSGNPPQLSITYSVPPQFLTVSIDAAAISENGGATTATVTRTDTSGALAVDLVSSDTSEATVLASVTIPDGRATSDPFTISAVDDGLLDGEQTVTISAMAAGFEPGRDVLNILDDETTAVRLVAGDLVIEDAAGGQTDDQLTLAVDGSDLLVRDAQSRIAAEIPGASGQGTTELRVPLNVFAGQLIIQVREGDNTVSLDSSVDNDLAARISFVGGSGQDRLTLLGTGVTLGLAQFSNFDHIDIAGLGANGLNVDLAAALNNVDNAADALVIVSDVNDDLSFDAGWSIPETFVSSDQFFRVLRKVGVTLHVAGPSDWQNPAQPLDVSGDGVVVSRDALLIINELNQPTFTTGAGRLMDATGLDPFPLFFFDVLGTGFATPGGAARIIDFLNARLREGEGEGEADQASRRLRGPVPPDPRQVGQLPLELRQRWFAAGPTAAQDRPPVPDLFRGMLTVPATNANSSLPAGPGLGRGQLSRQRLQSALSAAAQVAPRDRMLEEVIRDLVEQNRVDAEQFDQALADF